MQTKPVVAISSKACACYPTGKYFYNPCENYPEYPFGAENIAKTYNYPYEMVREIFHIYGFDKTNYGTKEWNPLGEIIIPGDIVLVKPNWVMHINKTGNKQQDMESLVTHPSVVRAIVDYIYIALQGTGKIIVADAPMQECNISALFRNAGYDSLFEFWKKQDINIQIKDLRKYSSTFKNGVVIEKITNNASEGIAVEIGKKSLHCTNSQNTVYKVSDYSSKITNGYHNNKSHAYEINKDILQADVIISVPKPKCHRLAGMTAAMKNFVGITYDKASLPHRKLGGICQGGDSYKNKSYFKNLMQYFDEKKTELYNEERYIYSSLYSLFEKTAYVLGSIFSRDKIRVGGWYGNDTIWRTIADLNLIVQYANKYGKLCDTPQRKILSIGDMIICGERNGPISPTPKKLGMIMATNNAYIFDHVMCRIMGFEFASLKLLSDETVRNNMGIYDRISIDECIVNLDNEKFPLKDFKVPNTWHFEAHDMWKGHIEKTG